MPEKCFCWEDGFSELKAQLREVLVDLYIEKAPDYMAAWRTYCGWMLAFQNIRCLGAIGGDPIIPDQALKCWPIFELQETKHVTHRALQYAGLEALMDLAVNHCMQSIEEE